VFSNGADQLGVGTTDEDGVAEVTAPAATPAGTYPVKAFYQGDEDVRDAEAVADLVVVPEVTILAPLKIAKPNTTTRYATTTLLDDDKTPVAGQKIEWWVNGKKVATTTTDSLGQSTYKALKPGQSVQAKFSKVLGKYAAAAGKPVKV
jgi:hypothetical protein